MARDVSGSQTAIYELRKNLDPHIDLLSFADDLSFLVSHKIATLPIVRGDEKCKDCESYKEIAREKLHLSCAAIWYYRIAK